MKLPGFTFLFLTCLLFCQQLQATNYYLSMNGNDVANGRSPRTAWKTLQRLQQVMLRPGDSVLFEKGSRFEGEVIIRQSGRANRSIVFAAYGAGPLPVISGAIQLLADKENKDGKWTFAVSQKPTAFYVNDVWQQPARHPNSTFLVIGAGRGFDGFLTNSSLPVEWYVGSVIRMRTIDWVYEHRTIAAVKDGYVLMDSPSRYRFTPGYGYFLEGKTQFLDTAGEWIHNGTAVKWMAPPERNVLKAEAVIHQSGITVLPGVQHVVIESLHIEKYNGFGISLSKNTGNIDIKYCHFRQLGNSGVYADTLTEKLMVTNCSFADIDGRGISANRTSYSRFIRNSLHRIGLKQGYGISGVNGMIAIAIENNEREHTLSNSHHNVIAYNYIDSNGYAGIRMDGSQSTCEFNIVKNSSLKLNDAGGIYCFGKVKNRTYDNIIRNNLVINVTGNIEATPNNPFAANGIYIDNKSTGIVVENNTVLHCVSSGLVINDDAPRNILRNNLVYDASIGILFSEWANKDSIYGCSTVGNTVVAADKTQKPLSLLTYLGPDIKPGLFDNNMYINAHDGFAIEKRTDPNKWSRRRDELKLPEWQRISGQDKNSQSIERKNPVVLYNDTFVPRKMTLTPGTYTDEKGNPMDGMITLPACGAQLLFRIER